MPIGRFLIVAGSILIVMGVLISLSPKLPGPWGRLPGDIWVERQRFTFFFPLTTCLVLSLLLTLLLNLFFRR